MATGPIETHLHRSFNWENGAPGPREGPRGRSANCGSEPSAQCVRLRSEINHNHVIQIKTHMIFNQIKRCLASISGIARIKKGKNKKGQDSQFESVTLKVPKELLYCGKILYTIFP